MLDADILDVAAIQELLQFFCRHGISLHVRAVRFCGATDLLAASAWTEV